MTGNFNILNKSKQVLDDFVNDLEKLKIIPDDVVLNEPLKVLTFSNSFYFMNITVIIGSLGLLFLSMVYIDSVQTNSSYGVMSK